MRGADVCIALAKPEPNLIRPEWVQHMATGAIVFACANPAPEIWPWDAKAAGAAIVATGRGDFPNQVNNSLCFPGIFRGALDVRSRTITDGMAMAAARELARFAEQRGIHAEDLVPRMDEWEVYPRLAVATALQSQEEGVARLSKTAEELHQNAVKVIRDAQAATELLIKQGLIPPKPRVC
jgi:malate dehydrogenase (oxaloacetate-decarboxylating)